jgi:hypothetical protein
VIILAGIEVGERLPIRDATALDNARRRTDEQGCSSWVEFQASDLDEFAITDQFDALVGRYVLLYQPDPSSTIRSLLPSRNDRTRLAHRLRDFKRRASGSVLRRQVRTMSLRSKIKIGAARGLVASRWVFTYCRCDSQHSPTYNGEQNGE